MASTSTRTVSFDEAKHLAARKAAEAKLEAMQIELRKARDATEAEAKMRSPKPAETASVVRSAEQDQRAAELEIRVYKLEAELVAMASVMAERTRVAVEEACANRPHMARRLSDKLTQPAKESCHGMGSSS